MNELTDIHEREQKLPWKVSDAPDEFVDKLVGAIVGIEIPIVKLTGKWKLGQNRPEADQLGIIKGLMASDNSQSNGLANELNKYVESIKKG
ncbi:MAG: FMN-binding negative transcriptional regulator [Pseudomonadales bacterium]|nr:FMN-binding negative transcriptional regulator [Pseudomonadales bacterium]